MWFITLLVLAVAAVLIIKAVKAHSIRQSSETQDLPPTSGIEGSLESTSSSDTDDISEPSNKPSNKPPSGVSADEPSASAPAAPKTGAPVDRQSTLDDIREKIKILNLADSDAPRLGITAEEFNAIRHPDNSAASVPSSDILQDIAERLRRMTN